MKDGADSDVQVMGAKPDPRAALAGGKESDVRFTGGTPQGARGRQGSVGEMKKHPAESRQWLTGAEKDENGRGLRLIPKAPSEPAARIPLDFAAPVEVFLKTWKPDAWNQFRFRCVGQLPHLTTWINGVKVSELFTANIKLPNFDPKSMLATIGRSDHIALESTQK